MYLSPYLIFYPEAVFSPVDIGGILLVGLLSDATFLYSVPGRSLVKENASAFLYPYSSGGGRCAVVCMAMELD